MHESARVPGGGDLSPPRHSASTRARSPSPLTRLKQIAGRWRSPVVVKAQVHTGGRGKAGGIKLAARRRSPRAPLQRILGMDIRGHTVRKVLVAPAVEIAQEFYLGVVLDRPRRQILVMASAEGGVDIEEVARERPERIVRALADPLPRASP